MSKKEYCSVIKILYLLSDLDKATNLDTYRTHLSKMNVSEPQGVARIPHTSLQFFAIEANLSDLLFIDSKDIY